MRTVPPAKSTLRALASVPTAPLALVTVRSQKPSSWFVISKLTDTVWSSVADTSVPGTLTPL